MNNLNDYIKDFLNNIDVQEAINKENWGQFFNLLKKETYNINIPGKILNILLNANITNWIYSLPETIFTYCFTGFTNDTFVIPAHCKILNDLSFYGSGIKYIVIPPNIEKINQSAFSNCNQLISVIIEANVPEIPWGCFAGCSSLKEIVIPNTIKSLREECFNNCPNLESIIFKGTKKEWKAIFKYRWKIKSPNLTKVICNDGALKI